MIPLAMPPIRTAAIPMVSNAFRTVTMIVTTGGGVGAAAAQVESATRSVVRVKEMTPAKPNVAIIPARANSAANGIAVT